MKLNNLIEAFYKADNVFFPGDKKKKYVEIFKNPTQKEMMDASKEIRDKRYIRFISEKDGKGDLYVFRPDVFHFLVRNSLKNKDMYNPDGKDKDELWGSAIFKNSEWVNYGSDDYVPNKFDWEALNEKGIKGGVELRDSPNPLHEAFETSFTHPISKEYVEVFSNPTSKEMNEAARKVGEQAYLRFIADGKNKRLYVFSPLVIHRAAAKNIKRYSEGLQSFPGKQDLWGVAKKSGSGWEAITSDIIDGVEHKRMDVVEQDWSWLNKKIDVSPLLKKIEDDEDTNSLTLEPAYIRSKAKKLNKVEETIHFFFEEFAGADKNFAGDYIEIFVNPTMKEMQGLPKNVRYAIDGRTKNVKVYIWDGNLLHGDAAKVIDVPYPHNKVLWGIGKKDGNKVTSSGGIYPARGMLGRWKFLKMRNLPKLYGSEMKEIEDKAKYYLDPKWNTKWVDLSDFYEAMKEMFGGKLEEAFEAYAGKGEETVIFKNPTKAELREFGGFGSHLRFLIKNRNNKNNVYVFSDAILHSRAADIIGLNYPDDPNVIAGIAVKREKGWTMIDSFNLRSMIRKSIHSYEKMLETDWSNPYVEVKDYISKERQKKRR